MTHDELLTKISQTARLAGRESETKYFNALRAVIELHKPYHLSCSHCINIEGGYMSYPCPTIQAIEKELQ